MSDESQILVPPSFVALYLAPGRARPSAPRAEVAARHEFCEDLATMLTEHAANKLWELGVTEADVLERMHRGLLGDAAPVNAAEARWVIRRLAELLGWDAPTFDADPDTAAEPV
jgi:Fe2+ transport system protein FeoA